jgi:hypothetical protein
MITWFNRTKNFVAPSLEEVEYMASSMAICESI